MFWESLRKLQETEVKEDFLCIPEIEYYLKHEENYEDLGYFPEYKEILNYCEARNCQALIGNLNFGYSENLPEKEEDLTERVIYKVDENSYKVFWKGVLRDLNINSSCKMLFWGNTFIYNYSNDRDNRLVYFFRSMALYGVYPRPPYYLFLRGLLSGNYSESESRLKYIPATKNAFIEESIEKILEGRKSNYLVYNNQEYFYKNYQNHPGDGIYNTTILTRWSMSKISKTLENNKWSFLGKQSIWEIKSNINRLLLELSSTYSIYRSISLIDINIDYTTKSMTLNIKSYLRELVDKPVYLDVEINYY